MKNKISVLLTVIVTLFGTYSATSQEKKKKDIKEMQIKVDGMTCAVGCAKGIEGNVYKLKGVKSSKVNFEEKLATIVYDANKVDKKAIIEAIEGYNPAEEKERKYVATVLKDR